MFCAGKSWLFYIYQGGLVLVFAVRVINNMFVLLQRIEILVYSKTRRDMKIFPTE